MVESDDVTIARQTAMQRAYFYLRFRPRTKHEIQRYLEQKAKKYHWNESIIQDVVKSLEEQGLINDDEFVRLFVEKRMLHKPKGERGLRQELLTLGIGKDLLDKYFSSHTLDEYSQAKQALEPKWSRLLQFDKQKRFQKAAQFLARRGFSFDVGKKTIAEMEGKEYN